MDMKTWLEQATKKIEFDPDRAAVRRELEDHLQDRRERYAAKGMGEEEAERAALADMGNPADIAEDLGRLHRPWWGYIWSFSKFLLALSIFTFALTVGRWAPWTWTPSDPPPLAATDPERALATTESAVAAQKFSGSAQAGAYKVTATAFLTSPEEDCYSLALYLRCAPKWFWEPSVQRRYFIIVTDNSDGVQYPADGVEAFPWQCWNRGPVTWYELRLVLEEPKFPDWLDVSLGASYDYTVRLDFREGVLRQ